MTAHTAHRPAPITIVITDRRSQIRFGLWLLVSHSAVAVASWSAFLLTR